MPRTVRLSRGSISTQSRAHFKHTLFDLRFCFRDRRMKDKDRDKERDRDKDRDRSRKDRDGHRRDRSKRSRYVTI